MFKYYQSALIMFILLTVLLFFFFIPVGSDFMKWEAGSVGARARQVCFILHTLYTLQHLQAGKRSARKRQAETHTHYVLVRRSHFQVNIQNLVESNSFKDTGRHGVNVPHLNIKVSTYCYLDAS